MAYKLLASTDKSVVHRDTDPSHHDSRSTHTVYGFGLYLTATAVAALIPAGKS